VKRYQVVQNEGRNTQTANITTDGAAKVATEASMNCRNAAGAGNLQGCEDTAVKCITICFILGQRSDQDQSLIIPVRV